LPKSKDFAVFFIPGDFLSPIESAYLSHAFENIANFESPFKLTFYSFDLTKYSLSYSFG